MMTVKASSKPIIKALKKIDYRNMANGYLFLLAKQLQKRSISKTANVSGEMIRETTAFISKPGVSTVAINVPYGSYNHEGQRADGSRTIKNRTSPGQKYGLRKAAQELDLNQDVNVILNDLSKKLL